MSLGDRLQNHLRDEQQGMLYDILFALVWVSLVSALFQFVFVTGPTWAYYLFMLCGIPAYFGFFWSLRVAKAQQDNIT
jgi:hypothetical protein